MVTWPATNGRVINFPEPQIHRPYPQGRVLIVDDERGPRQALRMLLNDRYEVFLAQDVDSGLQIVRAESIDVIITDLRMPGQTGVDLLRGVKAQLPDIEVIILTGYGQLDSAMHAVEFGAFAYMEKPFDNDTMLRQVQTAIDKRKSAQERKKLEQLALVANRFEILGRVVSGMIHDLGTPLSVISAQVEMMMLELPESAASERLDIMYSQVRHCSDIIRSTMQFLNNQSDKPVLLNLNDVVDRCMSVAKPLFRKQDIFVEVDLQQDLPSVAGNFVMIQQALLNVITNACQAMEHQSSPRAVRVKSWSEDGQIFTSVSDTGPGIAEKDRERVFESFYTTKGAAGTGLGLAVVMNVMHRHNGRVLLEQNEDGGAQFKFQFPAPNHAQLLSASLT
jgi:signal transduction histidine kinase